MDLYSKSVGNGGHDACDGLSHSLSGHREETWSQGGDSISPCPLPHSQCTTSFLLTIKVTSVSPWEGATSVLRTHSEGGSQHALSLCSHSPRAGFAPAQDPDQAHFPIMSLFCVLSCVYMRMHVCMRVCGICWPPTPGQEDPQSPGLVLPPLSLRQVPTMWGLICFLVVPQAGWGRARH